jgi:geranylgeranyl pyrophosphate synthase
LLQDDCKDTTIDVEWVWDMIHLTSDDRTWRLDLDRLREEVQAWFTASSMDRLFGCAAETETERIARAWLAKDGKRWRPLLTACAYKAFQEDPNGAAPEAVRKVALAVECFHKASLIHDDIEDDDEQRYGQATVHAEHGVAIALNVGDLLVGEGYRLLAESGAPARVIAQMIRIASAGHRSLCLGQGLELCWSRRRHAMGVQQVLSIFRQKTAPAFEVALRLGAALAEAEGDVHDVLTKYSEALGIAYQIRDDLDDLAAETGPQGKPRPALPLAEALDRARGDERAFLDRIWTTREISPADAERLAMVFEQQRVEERSRQLLESYKEAAVRSLAELHNPSLKGLLRRVIAKIFRVEIQGWCSEFEARNAAGRETVAQVAG